MQPPPGPWWCGGSWGQTQGLTTQQVAQIFVSYPGPHYVWMNGMAEWVPAENVPEIATAIRAMGGQTTVDTPSPAGGQRPDQLEAGEEGRFPLDANKLIFVGVVALGLVLVCGLGGLVLAGHAKQKKLEDDRARRAAMATPAPTPEVTPEPTPPPPPPVPRVRSESRRPLSWNRVPIKDRRRLHGEGMASSTLIEANGTRHTASRIADVKGDTAWCENSPDDGIGEWVELSMDCGSWTRAGITGMGVRAGYGRTARLWEQNNRVSEALITVDISGRDAWTAEVMFDDVVDQQFVPFDASLRCDSGESIRARLEIVGVFQGKNYTDTCISTMSFYSPGR